MESDEELSTGKQQAEKKGKSTHCEQIVNKLINKIWKSAVCWICKNWWSQDTMNLQNLY